MEINALLMDPADNVVTCVNEVPAGEKVVYRKGEKVLTLTALEDIPYCHKVALVDIAKGAEVIKYGESLGETSEDIPEGADIVKYGESLGHTSAYIPAGHWVAHHNLFSVPRDYDSEMLPL